MRQTQFLTISLFDLLLIVTALPIAIGFIATSMGLALYVEIAAFNDPLRHVSQVAANWMLDSRNAVSEIFFLCLMVSINSFSAWTGAAIAVVSFALPRSKISRIYAALLLISAPIIRFIFDLPLTDQKGTLLVARCISTFMTTLLLCTT